MGDACAAINPQNAATTVRLVVEVDLTHHGIFLQLLASCKNNGNGHFKRDAILPIFNKQVRFVSVKAERPLPSIT